MSGTRRDPGRRSPFVWALLVLSLALVASVVLGHALRELAAPARHDAGLRAHAPPPVRLADADDEPAPDLETLAARVDAIVERDFTAGVSVAVVEGGRTVWATGFGTSDLETGTPAGPDTMYRVGSFSKTFVSLALVELEARGAFELRDRVRDVAPEIPFENPWADESPVLVSYLVEHTTGFDEMRFNEIVAPPEHVDLPLVDVLALNPRSRRVRWRPGTRHGYSHPGYTLAGYIIEAASGEAFDTFIDGLVMRPLGMRASFRPTQDVLDTLAPSYDRALALTPHIHLYHRPGGSLYASARDIGRFLELMAGRGVVDGERVLPASRIERMERGSTLPYPELGPTYGLGVYSTPIRGLQSYGHGGWMPFHNSVYRYIPQLGAGFVLLTNEPRNAEAMWEIERELRRYLVRDVPRPTPPEPVELEDGALRRLAGMYRYAAPEVQFLANLLPPATREVSVEGEDLAIRGHQVWYDDVYATGPTTFRLDYQRRSSISFTTSPEGQAILVDANNFGYYERCSLLGRAWVELLWNVQGLFIVIAFTPLLWLGARAVGWRPRGLGLVLAPAVAAWAWLGMVGILFHTHWHVLGAVNARTIAVFALSWAFGLLTLAALVHTARHVSDVAAAGAGTRWFALIGSVALALWCARLAAGGLIGVRSWLW